MKNEINILEILFGDVADILKKIIKKVKEAIKKSKPASAPEQIIVHQYRDYNNVN